MLELVTEETADTTDWARPKSGTSEGFRAPLEIVRTDSALVLTTSSSVLDGEGREEKDPLLIV
jgi:hypothetical protein